MKSFLKTVAGAFIGTLIALLVLVFAVAGMVGSVSSMAQNEAPAVPTANVILRVTGAVTEQSKESFAVDPISSQFEMSTSISLLKAVQAIEKAASDPAVKMLYICPDCINASISTMEELRTALERFRASGKPIISYSEEMTSEIYYLASVADKIIVNAYTEPMFAGLSADMMFYKDLIDKLGIDIQLIRHGKYKSAGEPFIKNDISKENREQYETMLGSMWKTMVDASASGRDFSAEEYSEWVDKLQIADLQDAKAKGIVDETWFKDELEEYLCSVCGVEDSQKLNIVELDDYAAAKVKANLREKNKIAVIYANGEIVMGNGSDNMLGSAFAGEIAKARKDSTVKAVVFRVNSPGGSVQASAIIAREVELLKKEKPVIASYGDYAASGGYWISCGCDKIFTDKTTLTGSIGVFGIIPSFDRAIKQNLHVNTVEVSSTSHGALATGLHPLDQEEEAWMQHSIENIYTDFTSRVSEGRGMSVEAVDEVGQGRVWTGADAVGIGLADETGTLNDAISYAASAVDLDSYRIVEYPAAKTTMEKLMEMFGSSASVKVEIPEAMEPAMKDFQWLTEIKSPMFMARMEAVPSIHN